MSKRVDFDNYTSNYNQLLRDETGFFSSSEEYFAQYKVDIVREQMCAPVSRLLEYGCGIGRNIPFLCRAFPGAIVVGSDISGASLEVARQENENVEFFHEDGNVKSIEPFDMIFVAGVFHHVPVDQRVAVAKALFDRLSPGGKLFVFEHNPYNPITRRIVNNCPYDEDAVLLKPSKLLEILVRAELLVDKKEYCLFVPPSLSVLKGFERLLGWLPLGGQYWMQARRPL